MVAAAHRVGAFNPGEWLCVDRHCGPLRPMRRAGVLGALALARTTLPGRVLEQRWVRYRIALGDAPLPPDDVRLVPVTDYLMRSLRTHHDRDAEQLKSGFRFWDHGLRRAYVWIGGGEPLCIQWLLLESDIDRLHTLGMWAGMYAPLPPRCGQVENLFAFSGARRKGVATHYEYALYARARRMGLSHLITHIHEGNAAARGWADRTGWRAYGVITRYSFDVPGLRAHGVFLHAADSTRYVTVPLEGQTVVHGA